MKKELPNIKHRVQPEDIKSVLIGKVSYSPIKSLWVTSMALSAIIGGTIYFSWIGLLLFLISTGTVLLLGHSLGSHRKLIHDSYQCPKWLEHTLVYFGVQVGLCGPIGLLKQHDLRDYAQRLPVCHDYLRHGSSFLKDAWWQLHCELTFANPPLIVIETRIEQDKFYQFLEKTWMLQQIPLAVIFYLLGGLDFVILGVCARITACVTGHWLIGYFAHNHGPMTYEVTGAAVQGHNIPFTSILTMGECWHNNHHAYPGSAKLGLKPHEFDPGWQTLLILEKMGLVWNLQLPEYLPHRPELVRIKLD
jgi:fatty-acid desaturase